MIKVDLEKVNKLYEKAMIYKKLGDREKEMEAKWEIALLYKDRLAPKLVERGVENNDDVSSEVLIDFFNRIDGFDAENNNLKLKDFLTIKIPRVLDKAIHRGTKVDDSLTSLNYLDGKTASSGKDFTQDVLTTEYVRDYLYPMLANMNPAHFLIFAYRQGLLCKDIPGTRDMADVFGTTFQYISKLEESVRNKLEKSVKNDATNPESMKTEMNYRMLDLLKARDDTTNIPLTQHTLALFGIDSFSQRNLKVDESGYVPSIDKTQMLASERGQDLLSINDLIECIERHENILTRPREKDDLGLLSIIQHLNSFESEQSINLEADK